MTFTELDSSLIPIPSKIVSWNAMIDGHCKAGQLSLAEALFNRIGDMKNKCSLIVSFINERTKSHPTSAKNANEMLFKKRVSKGTSTTLLEQDLFYRLVPLYS